MAHTINWIDRKTGAVETTEIEPGACPFCFKSAVTRLPTWLLAVQLDGTTHVCHPSLGGCNHGFAKEN